MLGREASQYTLVVATSIHNALDHGTAAHAPKSFLDLAGAAFATRGVPSFGFSATSGSFMAGRNTLDALGKAGDERRAFQKRVCLGNHFQCDVSLSDSVWLLSHPQRQLLISTWQRPPPSQVGSGETFTIFSPKFGRAPASGHAACRAGEPGAESPERRGGSEK